MLISKAIRAECNSKCTPRCKVVYTHARTFQGAWSSKRICFKVHENNCTNVGYNNWQFVLFFVTKKSLDILNTFLCGMRSYGILNKMLDVVRDIGKLVKPRSHPHSSLLPGWNSCETKNESKGRDSDVLSKTPDFKRRVLFFYHK